MLSVPVIWLVAALSLALLAAIGVMLARELSSGRPAADLDVAWAADVELAIRGVLLPPYAIRMSACQPSEATAAIDVIGVDGRARMFVLPPLDDSGQAAPTGCALSLAAHPAVALLMQRIDASIQAPAKAVLVPETRIPAMLRCHSPSTRTESGASGV